jgi:hypothetical protein
MANQPDRHLRAQLPIPEVPKWGLTTYDAKDPDTKYPPIEPLRPPAGAPNVLIVLLDDAGFGASSSFGGPCHTPTLIRKNACVSPWCASKQQHRVIRSCGRSPFNPQYTSNHKEKES